MAWWIRWAAPLFLLLFILVAATLLLRQHAAFHTSLYDLGYYTQVVWNTAHGRWFETSLKDYGTFLADHFSPILLFVAPLFWLFPDARTLLVVEVAALATAVLPAYLILRPRYPALAPLVVLAFVFNTAVHQLATYEFHEIMLAAPTLALAVYAHHRQNDRLLLAGLGLTLLVREDMGIYVAAFGLVYLLFHPGRRWLGLVITLAGVLWSLALIAWVIPAFGAGYYPHVQQFGEFGDSAAEIVVAMLQNPGLALQTLFTVEKGTALFKLLFPLLFLPLLARGEQLLWLLPILLLLLSTNPDAVALDGWYMAPLLPLLWGVLALVLEQQRRQWVGATVLLLLMVNGALYILGSPFPGGGNFDAGRYHVAEHHRIGHQVVRMIPPDAAVAAQSGLGAHLGARKRLHLFPWFAAEEPPDVVALDATGLNSYPFHHSEIERIVIEYQADPYQQVMWEQDGYYLFRRQKTPQMWPAQRPATWLPWLQLEGYSVAQADGAGAFLPVEGELRAERPLRVELYLTALAPMEQMMAISVRLQGADGWIVAQSDGWPAQGLMPTLAWPPGKMIRDTHYLELPAGALPSTLNLVLVLYDAATLQAIEPAAGYVLPTAQRWE